MTTDALPAPADVLLADGTIAVVRPLVPQDREQLLALHDRVSDESLRLRFFAPGRNAGRSYAEHLVAAGDGTLVLLAEAHGRVLGVASAEIDPDRPDAAEVAFLVADEVHGHGVGTLLLEHLAAAARRRRIRWFTADVLVENQAMLRVFTDAGYPATRRTSAGVITWEVGTDPTESGLSAADERQMAAERSSLRPLLYPTSVAVVGVRRRGGGVGHAVLTSILRGDFAGDLWVIHPAAVRIDGVPARPDLGSVPGHVDVLVVAVPAAEVLEVVSDAAAHGVSAVVVLSSGFSELGAAGAHLQRAVLRIAREHDMRILGPNCLGLLCNDPAVRLNATFSAAVPGPGGLAVASQSGGVGIALLDLARDRGLGVHSFVSLGNQSDVSGNDLLAAWYDDPQVGAAALYLEELGAPLTFARLARRFSQRKPLLAVAGGRSSSGARGGASHTAAAATPAVAIDALFAQTGVVPCRSTSELVRTADLLATQPLPRGRRLGVVSNAGGIGILAADAADAAGLVVPELSAAAQSEVARHVDGTIGTGNPIDLGAGVGAADLGAAVSALLGGEEVDAVLVAVVATSVNDPGPAIAAVTEATRAARAQAGAKPVLLVTMGGIEVSRCADGPTLFADPEEAVQALAHALRYAEWRTMPRDAWVEHDLDRADAAHDVALALVGDGTDRWLEPAETDRLLGAYGIHTLGRTADGAEAAARAAVAIGFPVAVKVATAGVLHKTDRGLVALGLTSAEEVSAAVRRFATELRIPDVPVLVQPHRTGVELALGITRHSRFGPLVMVAAGGVTTNLLDDRAFAVPPLTRQDAARALRSLRIWPTLDGYRGAELVDVSALEDLLVDLGQVARDLPEVVELDLNPVVVTPQGVSLLDVKVRVAAGDDPAGSLPRQLAPGVGTSPQRAPSTPQPGTNDSSAVPEGPPRWRGTDDDRGAGHG